MILTRNFAYLILALLPASFVRAQTVLDQNQYKSPAGEVFHIERLTVSPFFDNADGIYARPLERHLIENLSASHRFDFIPASSDFKPTSPEEFLRNEDAGKLFGQKEKVDAFFTARVTNFPASGLQISMYLFLTRDGQPLIQGELKNLKNDSIDFLKGQLDLLTAQVLARLPYAGRVMSREGLQVTLNLGLKDGVKKGQELTAVQFLSVNRHPKLKFLINSEKEVIGKIKLLKVEPTLSFGAVQMEKEKGIIQPGTKINSLGEVRYTDIETGFEGPAGQLPDNPPVYGENPKEWRPLPKPAFGRVHADLGFMRYEQNLNLQGVSALSAKSSFSPAVELGGELWLTSEWTIHAEAKQALIMTKNPRSNSSPKDLSQTLSAYEFLFGYRFRFGPDGPSSFAEPFVGYFNDRFYSDSAQPESFTSMTYHGLKFGVMGEFPITEDQVWSAGGKISFALSPGLSESPVTSGGSSDNSVIQFQFFGAKALSRRLRALGKVDFEQFSTNFSGTGTRAESADSGSIRFMTFAGGLSYSF